jgi:hypothetical protein
MVTSQILVPETLAAVIANERSGLPRLKLIDLGLGLILILILSCFTCFGSLNLFHRFVLVVL